MLSPNYRTFLCEAVVIAAMLLVNVLPAQAQAKKDEKPEIPEPKPITLETKDGVSLRCTWYGGTLEKATVPVVMLPGWGGVRGDYAEVAKSLQNRGHAVIVPDLRGHGESTSMQVGDEVERLDYKKMSKNEIVGMLEDLKAVKKFLLDKNNEGELNIELLCVVSADVSCILAMNWALYDWSLVTFPNGVKQGRDIKALVLLSPTRSYKGLTTTAAEKHPLFTGRADRGGTSPLTLSVMIMVGERDRKSLLDAKQIHNSLERTRPKLPDDRAERVEKQDLFLLTRDVELQGTTLLDPELRLNLESQLAAFIHYRLEKKESEFSWTNRSAQD